MNIRTIRKVKQGCQAEYASDCCAGEKKEQQADEAVVEAGSDQAASPEAEPMPDAPSSVRIRNGTTNRRADEERLRNMHTVKLEWNNEQERLPIEPPLIELLERSCRKRPGQRE